MDGLSSHVVAPERVREETALAPLLLQTEELTVAVLADRLKQPVTVKLVKQAFERGGLRRRTLLQAADLPLLLAVTYVRPLPETRGFIRTLQRTPTMPLGEALRTHRLFGKKSAVEIRRTPCPPDYRALFGVDDSATSVWERTYAILSPKGRQVAGITEIFSPKLEVLFQEYRDS